MTARFRQVILSRVPDPGEPSGWQTRLEILKAGQKGPRRSGVIRGDDTGILILASFDSLRPVPLAVALDWLEDHAGQVSGLKQSDVLDAIAAVRRRGFWFVTPEKKRGTS